MSKIEMAFCTGLFLILEMSVQDRLDPNSSLLHTTQTQISIYCKIIEIKV
jgi:hypothetical protein